MKTFKAICKDIGQVFWRYKKNRRKRVYEFLTNKETVNFYHWHAQYNRKNMTKEQLFHLSKPPLRLGGNDTIWNMALSIYNEENTPIKLMCFSHYRTVARFVWKRFDFDPAYYQKGISGLSQAALDQIRAIVKEEVSACRNPVVTMRDIQLPKDSIMFR